MPDITIEEVQSLMRGSAPGNVACRVRSVRPYVDALTVGSDGCERLEFLGDAILSVVVTQYLFERFPSSREGFLSKMRSKIVSSRMLSQLGELLDVGSHVLNHTTGSVAIDDILEALIAAISIDAGMDAAKTWFINVLEHHVDISALVSWHDSNKQRLAKLSGTLTFTEISSPRAAGGVSVCVRDSMGVVLGTATARNRRDAEEDASRKALVSRHGHGGAAVLPRHAMASREGQRCGRAVTASCG